MEKEYKLKNPIQLGSEKIEVLKFREPKAKDFREMPMSPKFGDMLNLAAKISNNPPSTMDQLSVLDMQEVLKLVGEYMGDGQPIGVQP